MNRSTSPSMPLHLCAALLVALSTLACQQETPSTQSTTTPATQAVETSTAPEEAPDVVFEPAYPEEVSSETLNAGDVAQQSKSHSHGDGEHSHGADEAHDEGPGHDGEPGHGDEDHSHDSDQGGDHDHGG